MIDREHELPVTHQARLLGISRGTVYYLPKPASDADLSLMRRLDLLHLEHPFMGARMLRRQLQREGIHVGRRHVRTLMRCMGLEALCPQPGTSQRHPGHKVYPYLLRNLAITRANQVWALDTSYIPMARGFVYLTAVVDVASRMVLAHKVAITLESCHAREVIEQAFARHGVPEIVNTDQGSSPPRSSRPPSSIGAANCRWMDAGPGATMCSLSACGVASSTSTCISRPTTASTPPGSTSGGTSTGSTRKGRIRASGISRRLRPP